MGSNMAEKWEELSGKKNWKGLLNPLDIDLRRYILRYGEIAQVCGDTFISEKYSKNAGTSRYSPENLLTRVGLDHIKYRVTKYIYATSSVPLPDDYITKSKSSKAWSKESNWMGFVAVATDEGKIEIGRRDIVISWRGTSKRSEWIDDFIFVPVKGPIIFGDDDDLVSPKPLLHFGFYNIYTSENEKSPFNKISARDQVIGEVKKLVEEYKDEEVSITVTGHSLGASLAALNAVDIAFNGFNKTSQGKEFPVTAFPFACPKVGDSNFKATFEKLNNNSLHILRIHNVLDVVPLLPPSFFGYVDVGEELLIDTAKSPYLKELKEVPAHNLEIYLHGVAGSHGVLAPFKLEVERSYELVNKQTNALKDEFGVPEYWWIEKNKAMVQQKDGSWIFQDREDYPF